MVTLLLDRQRLIPIWKQAAPVGDVDAKDVQVEL